MTKDGNQFIGVDVGGTKIHAAVTDGWGLVLKRNRLKTPRGASAEYILQTIITALHELLDKAKLSSKAIRSIGLAVPGVVDYGRSMIVTSPNIAISGLNLTQPLQDEFQCPVELANDVDAAVFGEFWLGAAQGQSTVVGIWPGTGVGGGIIRHGEILRGARYSTAEIGHMVLDRNGPICGCGKKGCLEALASRTAIERDLRAAVQGGETTILSEWVDDFSQVRSGMLAKAFDAGDELTIGLLRQAAEALGEACVSLRQLLDPGRMILGGGVVEACGDFILPIVRDAVAADPYLGRREGGVVLQSMLGDDAGVLGAAAVGMRAAGLAPEEVKKKSNPPYPGVSLEADGTVILGKKEYDQDVLLRVTGKGKRRAKGNRPPRLRSASELTRKDLKRAIKGGPEQLVIGAPDGGAATLPEDGCCYLANRGIAWEIHTPSKAVKQFLRADGRKALLMLTAKE